MSPLMAVAAGSGKTSMFPVPGYSMEQNARCSVTLIIPFIPAQLSSAPGNYPAPPHFIHDRSQFLAMEISHDQQDQGSCETFGLGVGATADEGPTNMNCVSHRSLSLSAVPAFLLHTVGCILIMADKRTCKRLANSRDLAVSSPGTNTPVPGHDSGLPS
ncbi:hypothetical protein FOPG_03996 [Fusarium oxysporum f. sp. conglutinans race 2 54008]|uniref:Uncharacterized protein n=1 Tax=Fusarium oxysporum f. sp. conglutinans race 2 54008 TaxID=1089457 RepID=X0IHS9_FUSOX|nr:hypothetical protein FOPG_03996 [Fusarium oxysporum f. sp. conglutinans race 2 54008]